MNLFHIFYFDCRGMLLPSLTCWILLLKARSHAHCIVLVSGKAAKRGNRHDSGKLVATLCHYYSDGAMGCKECFEVARSHRSNHNSTLLPPCKSVQGIKRRSWTLEDGKLLLSLTPNESWNRTLVVQCYNLQEPTCWFSYLASIKYADRARFTAPTVPRDSISWTKEAVFRLRLRKFHAGPLPHWFAVWKSKNSFVQRR